MCAQSNTSITIIRKRNLPIVVAMVMSLLWAMSALGQSEVSIQPIEQSSVRFTNVDLFFYGAGMISYDYFNTANANYTSNSKLYNTHLDFGVSAEVFRLDLLRFCTSLGYIHERYAYERGFTNNSGVMAHWLTADINITATYLGIGACTSVFLNSQIKNDNHFSYNGLYSSCFNRMTFCAYMALLYRFSGIKIEVREGVYFPPQINPDKLAYYNFQSSSISRLYLEIRLSFRWFHTGRRFKSLTYVQ